MGETSTRACEKYLVSDWDLRDEIVHDKAANPARDAEVMAIGRDRSETSLFARRTTRGCVWAGRYAR
jgi:hypothetical protein